MAIDVLCAELERLFDLEELLALSEEMLGLNPEEVGHTGGLSSFARALAQHCVASDSLDALCDTLVATRPSLLPVVARIRLQGAMQRELQPGESFAGIRIVRKLGDGPLGTCYAGTEGDRDVRLKIVRRDSHRDRAGLNRYLTLTRLARRFEHPALPNRLRVGREADLQFVVHELPAGEPLTSGSQAGPRPFEQLRPLLIHILEALGELHRNHVAHGNLKRSNVIADRSAGTAVLIDAFADRTRSSFLLNGHFQHSGNTWAPEQLQLGAPPSAGADLYAFGALLYELLTGHLPFVKPTEIETVVAQLGEQPLPPSALAPSGWIARDLDQLVMQLLDKNPAQRPPTVETVLAALAAIERPSLRPPPSDAELDRMIESFVDSPADEDAAVMLAEAAASGADARRIARAFEFAATRIEDDPASQTPEIGTNLRYRAARLFEKAEDFASSESVYKRILERRPGDKAARAALDSLQRKLGKYEELVESLLREAEGGATSSQRAEAWARIAAIYGGELADPEQALIAYTQAFCEEPGARGYAAEIDRLASSVKSWEYVLTAASEAAKRERPLEDQNHLLLRMGRWYGTTFPKPELAIACFESVLANDSGNDAALEGLEQLYKKEQRFAELGAVLLRRGNVAPTPRRSRELRLEAAEILEKRLGDLAGTAAILRGVVAEHPDDDGPYRMLTRIYEQTGDYGRLVELLESRLAPASTATKIELECQMAEVCERHLGDPGAAARHYQRALGLDPDRVEALRGLGRLYEQGGQARELLANLTRQIEIASTPRQRIALLEQAAALHAREFFRFDEAASALEAALALDPTYVPALTALAKHYRALGRWQDLAELYQRHASVVEQTEARVGLLLERARVLEVELKLVEAAMGGYEQVLAVEPNNSVALRELARLRERAGNAGQALDAIQALAEQATTAEERANHYRRAARLLESQGDLARAIDLWRRACDADQRDRRLSAELRRALVEHGEAAVAADLLERELELTDGDGAKASLLAELAALAFRRPASRAQAERAARKALELDPAQAEALLIASQCALESGNYADAAMFAERLGRRVESLRPSDAVRAAFVIADASLHSASSDATSVGAELLLERAPDDREAIRRAAQVFVHSGKPERAADLYDSILTRFSSELGAEETVHIVRAAGEAQMLAGSLRSAIEMLEQAVALDPTSVESLQCLAKAQEQQGSFEAALETKARLLEMASGAARSELLVQMGELCADKLANSGRAVEYFARALELRPENRNVLLRLMRLYSEQKDWANLVEIVVALAGFVDDNQQKAKYFMTAAMVSARELGLNDQALDYYQLVLNLDPASEKALDESIALLVDAERFEQAASQLRIKIQRADADHQHERFIATLDELGRLYRDRLQQIDHAIEAFEAARAADPDDLARTEALAALYAKDLSRHFAKAVDAQLGLLRRDPYRIDAYKQLRKLYTEARQPDPSFCLCQALHVLKLAEPDEDRFFKRMRAAEPAYAQTPLSESDWLDCIFHEDVDPVVTDIFILIEPAVIAARAQSFAELGFDAQAAIDPSQRAYLMGQTLNYALAVTAVPTPYVFENPRDPGGITLLHSNPKALALGIAAMTSDVHPQMAAFLAGLYLTYYRPGFFLRHLVSSGTGLKSWLFGAIKLISPAFQVDPDLENPIAEATQALDAALPNSVKDELARAVSRLLKRPGGIDLKQWVKGVDLTADRMGFILCNDLPRAVEVIRSSETGSSVETQQRLKELVRYAIGQRYFDLRQHLGIAIG